MDETPVVPRVSDLSYIAASARGKIELTMSEDDGHEDKLIGRLLAEAVKNVFDQYFEVGQFRNVVEYFESGKSIELGDQISSRDIVERLGAVPGFTKLLNQTSEKLNPELLATPARQSLTASVGEFILEGLHVHNKLNKNEKPGRMTYRR
jgi:magnesium chelatase subunit I